MFQKINFSFKSAPNFERLKGDIVTSYGRSPRPVLTYYRLKDVDYFNSLLPDIMPWKELPPFQVQLAEIVDNHGGHLLPHIDHNISACANYYVQTGESTTHFYRLKENRQGFTYPGRQVANIFTLDQVEGVSKFLAQDNDMYLLNVAKIHSVESPKPGIRQFISWQWVNVPFERIVGTLEK